MSISKFSCSVFFILLAFLFWKYFLLLTYSLSKNYKSLSHYQVGPDGLEPSTPRLSSVCSNQLSYEPSLSLVEPNGFEPMTC